jgi:hypothetical protein
MEIQERQQGDVLILEPAGRLDSLTCRALETRLLAALDPTRGTCGNWGYCFGSPRIWKALRQPCDYRKRWPRCTAS